MLHSPPDLRELRRHAIEARDGFDALGIRIPPTVFVQVHADVMLALLDAVDPRLLDASTKSGRLPAGWLDDLEQAVAELNQAVVGQLPLTPAVGRIVRLLHTARERTAA